VLLGNGAISPYADPTGENLGSRVVRLKLFPNAGLDALDFSGGEGTTDPGNLSLTVGVIGGELALVRPLLVFLRLHSPRPSLPREMLRVERVVLLEPAECFNVKVRLTRLGESVINEPPRVSHGVPFQQEGGKGGLFFREAELVHLVRPVELLVEVPHDLLRLLDSVFVSRKGKRKLRLHAAPIEMLVVLEEAPAGAEDEVKAVSLRVLLYFTAFDEACFLQRFEVLPQLVFENMRAVLERFEPAEPGTADLCIVFLKRKVFRSLRAVDIREVEVQVLIECEILIGSRFSIRAKFRQKV
jgi:hypothetical protein